MAITHAILSHLDPSGTRVESGADRPVPTQLAGDGWSEDATADNAVATATRPGEAGKRHYITGVTGSFSADINGKLMEVLDGANVIWSGYVHDQSTITFAHPIAGAVGGAVSARLAASGSLTVLGAVSLTGYTAG